MPFLNGPIISDFQDRFKTQRRKLIIKINPPGFSCIEINAFLKCMSCNILKHLWVKCSSSDTADQSRILFAGFIFSVILSLYSDWWTIEGTDNMATSKSCCCCSGGKHIVCDKSSSVVVSWSSPMKTGWNI